jgi:hypothetical protein
LACAGLAALGLLLALVVGVVFLVQRGWEDAEPKKLVQELPSLMGSSSIRPPGRVVLSLSSAAVSVVSGPPGGPIRVESEFDPDVFSLEQSYNEDSAGGWVYRVDFHEKKTFHVSVLKIWIGERSPEVRIVLPRDLPFTLEARMDGGYLTLDLAGMSVTSAEVELVRGVLFLSASEPLPAPMERLRVKSRIGTALLRSLGNASPRELQITHAVGAVLADLEGAWLANADVDFQVALARGELRLPEGVRVEMLDDETFPRSDTGTEEIPRPTLRVYTHFDMGDIRVVD